MKFEWPYLLFSLLLVPVLIVLYLNVQKRRKQNADSYGLTAAMGEGVRSNRNGPAALYLLGMTVLLFSLSRPQATVSLPKYEGTVILVFDISGSMAAEDIEPTRMEAAKAAAADFVNGEPAGVRIGVVAFSDGGISIQKPGSNREVTLAAIERLVPRRGTSLGNGVLVALNTIAVDAGDPPLINASTLSTADDVLVAPQGWYPSAVIVLFSDGENNGPPDPLTVTDLAIDLGVRIYTVGVGSSEGITINVDGMNIHTQMDEGTLKAMADLSGGKYYYGGDQTELRRIYNDLEPALAIKPEELELTALFAGLGIILFLIAGSMSMVWYGRVI